MQAQDAVAAVFPDQFVAEAAVKRLTAAGVSLQSISVVCKRHSAGEKVTDLQDARLQDVGGRLGGPGIAAALCRACSLTTCIRRSPPPARLSFWATWPMRCRP